MTHYCRFRAVSETNDGIVEVCNDQSCKRRLVTKKDRKGRIDNMAYLKAHISDTCQPTGATSKVFAQLYGKPKV